MAETITHCGRLKQLHEVIDTIKFKLKNMLIQLNAENAKHPAFKLDQEYIMDSSCADLKRGKSPLELRIAECERRFVMEFGDYYLDIAKKLQNKFFNIMVDDKLKLSKEFIRNYGIVRVSANQISAGTKDEDGNYYVPNYRTFVPIAIYRVLQPIGKIITTWNNTTRIQGKILGDVAAYRKMCISNGVAENLIKRICKEYEVELDVEQIKNKLTTNFVPKNKKS